MPTSSSGAPTRAARSSACSLQQPHDLGADRAAAEQRATRSAFAHARARLATSVEAEQVGLGLAAHDHRRDTVADGDHRRARHVVVVAGHAAAVGAGRGDGDQVARRDVGRQPRVAHDDVAALAVLADHAGEHRGGRRLAVRDRAGVVGVVERGADVVAHPAVDRDVGAHRAAVERDLLHRADLVDGDRAGADDRPSRFEREARPAQARRRAFALDDRGQPIDGLLRRLGIVAGDVGDAQAAAEVDLVDLDAVRVADRRGQPDDTVRGDLEAGGLEDLRADVRVQAGQVQRRCGQHGCHGALGNPVAQREAELLILVRGGDVFVRVRFHADRHPDEDGLANAVVRGDLREALDLVERVDDDVPDAGVDRADEFGVATCCCRARRSARPGSPPASATPSSPPVQTSRPRPSSAIQRATVVHRNALPA